MDLEHIIPAIDSLDSVISSRFPDLDEFQRGKFMGNILLKVSEFFDQSEVFRVEVHGWRRDTNFGSKGTICELDPNSPISIRVPGRLSKRDS